MRCAAKAIFAAVLVAFSFTLPAIAQQPGFPQNMPPNTVYGRMGIGTGPGQAIPFQSLTTVLSSQSPINVLQFTADPTGVADSSAAFNAAVAACNGMGGCTIRVPSVAAGDTYLISSRVNIAHNNIFLQCDPGVVILNGTTNQEALKWGDGTNQYFSGGMDGCKFGQKGGVTPTTGNYGFTVNKLGQARFSNFSGTGNYNGFLFQTLSQSFIDNMQYTSALQTGVIINNGSDIYGGNWRSDANVANGYSINDTGGLYLSNVTGFNNTNSAWNFGTNGCSVVAGTCNANFFISHLIGDTSGNSNVVIQYCITCNFYGLWGSSQQSNSVNTAAAGITFAPGASGSITNVNVSGGGTFSNNANGVLVFDGGFGIPKALTFTGFDFGCASANGRAGGGGYGLFASNAIGTIAIYGGCNTSNPTGYFGIGASVTFSAINVSQYPVGQISLAGNLTVTGAFNPTFAIPGTFTYTFPGASASLAPLASPNFTGTLTSAGQIVSTAGLPTIASGACGASTNGAVVAGSTNQSGNITIGVSATTTCVLTWSASLAVAPNACVFFPANAAAAATGITVALVGAPSVTNVTLTGSALANANYSYICL